MTSVTAESNGRVLSCHDFSPASGKLYYWLLVCLGELQTNLNLNLI